MSLPELHLYDLRPPEPERPAMGPRWVWGDQYARAAVRRVRGRSSPRPIPSGFSVVARNLCLGLRKIRQPHVLHTRPDRPPRDAPVGIIHGPIDEVRELASYQPCVTGVGVLGAPEHWPAMFTDTKAVFHLQACEWAADHFRRCWGNRIRVWPVGIDTRAWKPGRRNAATTDFLIYDKVHWDRTDQERDLVAVVGKHLEARRLSFETIRYGRYQPEEYAAALRRCRALLFLCEHETQGLAYQEAMAAGLPVLAWDPGEWRDPRRLEWDIPHTPATSVPYFDERCGERFRDLESFPDALGRFCERDRGGCYAPRDYVLENLTLERCARRYVQLLEDAVSDDPAGSR